jgi:hypothetical protein
MRREEAIEAEAAAARLFIFLKTWKQNGSTLSLYSL